MFQAQMFIGQKRNLAAVVALPRIEIVQVQDVARSRAEIKQLGSVNESLLVCRRDLGGMRVFLLQQLEVAVQNLGKALSELGKRRPVVIEKLKIHTFLRIGHASRRMGGSDKGKTPVHHGFGQGRSSGAVARRASRRNCQLHRSSPRLLLPFIIAN
ncbi:hypothetical protein CLUG_05016 [Clavispora lusitaniae ATCC 42720]|uniref:Uncharacterized protein n=1 Tax=Clavispora lusitaniae (strain ATCC 42720) TaxID=306902 RepID=C4YA78_CLAL4|nr:uncharacterized protein CLUG_05016 [Clavispora lusitaniae ATCC 42720]EEQ40887.1 hypothetical protein CLUG_05016 [Clavispora lusitaniae ATCC 42720]